MTVLCVLVYFLVGLALTYVGVRWFGLPKDAAGSVVLCWPLLIAVMPLMWLGDWVAERAQR